MPEKFWEIPPDVAWTGDAERVVVLHLSGVAETPQVMEGPAAAIWMALAHGPASVSEIVTRLAVGFDTEVDALSGDVAAFVAQLAQRNLVATAERIAR